MKTLRDIASAYCYLAQKGADEAGFPASIARWYYCKFLFWHWVSLSLSGDAKRVWWEMRADEYAEAVATGRPPRSAFRLIVG
jgi:hypothetical protein